MKKILLGSTALLALSLTGTAQAAEKIKLGVSGYMWQEIGISDSRAGQTTVNLVSNTEVHFKGSTTLDNGLEIGADIQLEGNSQAADQIDESYAWIESKTWGKLILGTENGVGDLITTHAPSVGPMGVDGSNATYWVSNPSGNNALTTIDVAGSGDHEKVIYISPKLGGAFQVGASYTPASDAEDGKGPSSKTVNTYNIWEATALIDTTIAGVGVRTSASYQHGSDDTGFDNIASASAGLNLSYAGFTLGGGYGRTISSNRAGTANNLVNGWAYNVGISYVTGPYGVSLGMHHGVSSGDPNDAGAQEKFDTAELGFSYKLSDGVDLKSGVSYVRFEEDVELTATSGAVGTPEYENDGWVWINGIYLSF